MPLTSCRIRGPERNGRGQRGRVSGGSLACGGWSAKSPDGTFGRTGRGEAGAGRGHPLRGQPVPRRPGAEPVGVEVSGAAPPARDGIQPVLVDAESLGEEVGREGVMLAAEQEPVDVALAEPDRPSVVSS